MKNLIVLIVVVSCLWSCEKKVDVEHEKNLLMQLSADWSDLVSTGDMDAIMEGWSEEAIMMAPGFPPLKGKQAIRKYVEDGSKIPGFSIKWEPLEAHIAKSGDLAYLIERNVITVNDSLGNPIKTYNKVVTIWKKQDDGQWKNVIDMWNHDPEGAF